MAAKPRKAPRPKALPPRGFRDSTGAEPAARAALLSRVSEVYSAHGFELLETPAVETVEALGKFLPDVDRPNEGVFAWQEQDGPWLALRYDLTAPLARFYAQHRQDLPTPYRRYAMGPVWRDEKPGPGRFRQFYQCDADTVGAASMAADAEMCAMLADTLEAVGIKRGDYVVRVNNRKVLNGVMEVAGIGGPEQAAERGIVLRAIDKMDRLGEAGVRALLGEGRRDESGDFTKGAGLGEAQADAILGFVNARSEAEAKFEETGEISMSPGFMFGPWLAGRPDASLETVSENIRRIRETGTEAERNKLLSFATLSRLYGLVETSEIGREGVDELAEIADSLALQGYGADRIVIDPSVVRGLGYYTGPVFEAELTFEIKGEDGAPRQFGSVAGGGRYDDLVKRFTGQAVPATGVSLGVDRLLAALEARAGEAKPRAGPVVVTVMDRERLDESLAMAAELRAAGIRAEAYLGNPKNFGNQLKYADRRGAPAAVIAGSEEAARGVVQIKDLALGAALAREASLEEWKAQPAQREVPRDRLVAEIRAILDRA